MATIRKDKLKRLIEAGRVMIKCNYHLTDDYKADDANEFGKMRDYLPARIIETYKDAKLGYVNLLSCYFEWKNAKCYDHENGDICFYVHSNLNYQIKFTE